MKKNNNIKYTVLFGLMMVSISSFAIETKQTSVTERAAQLKAMQVTSACDINVRNRQIDRWVENRTGARQKEQEALAQVMASAPNIPAAGTSGLSCVDGVLNQAKNAQDGINKVVNILSGASVGSIMDTVSNGARALGTAIVANAACQEVNKVGGRIAPVLNTVNQGTGMINGNQNVSIAGQNVGIGARDLGVNTNVSNQGPVNVVPTGNQVKDVAANGSGFFGSTWDSVKNTVSNALK